jgi:hypothetical protein
MENTLTVTVPAEAPQMPGIVEAGRYSERFQYVDWTHDNKKDGINNKSIADGQGRMPHDPAFRTAMFTLDSLVYWHSRGMTFNRWYGTKESRFILIDIDGDHIEGMPEGAKIMSRDLDLALSRTFPGKYGFTRSTSLKDGNWHVFVEIPETVECREGREGPYADKVWEVADTIWDELSGIMGIDARLEICDEKMKSYRQSMFGCPVAEAGHIVVPGSSAPHLEVTRDHPEPRYVDTTDFAGEFRRSVPLNPGQFLGLLVDMGVLEERCGEIGPFFTAFMPWLKRKGGIEKIPEGKRSATLSAFAKSLCCCWKAANLFLSARGLGTFTVSDLVGTFRLKASGSYEETPDFDLGDIESDMISTARSWENMGEEWWNGQTRYAITNKKDGRTRTYFRCMDVPGNRCRRLIEANRTSPGTVTFDSKEALLAELSSLDVSEGTFRKRAREASVTVEYRDRKKSTGRPRKEHGNIRRGRPSSVSLEKILADVSGVLRGDTVVYSGKIGTREKVWLHRNGYKVNRLHK